MRLLRFGPFALITFLAAISLNVEFRRQNVENFLNSPFSIIHSSFPGVLAQTPADRKAEADRLFEQGIQQLDTSQFQAALQSFQQSLRIYREIGDRSGVANSLNNLGNAYNSKGQYQQAIEFYEQSLAIARELGDRSGVANSLNNLGIAYNFLGLYEQAIEFHQQSLAIAREIGDRQGEAKSLKNLGIAYNSLGQYQEAIEYYQQSLAIAREIGDRQGEAYSLGNLGIAHDYLGQYQKAIEYNQQSLAISRELGDRKGEAYSLGNMGRAYNSLGEYQQAIEYNQQGLAIARDQGDRYGEANSLTILGKAYNFLGQYQQAIEYHQQSLAISRDIRYRLGEGEALNNLGATLIKSGKLESAETALRKGIEVWESIREDLGSNDANKVSIFDMQANAYRLLQEALIGQNKTDAALEIAERGRARAFVELLASRLAADYVADLTAGLSTSPRDNLSLTSRTTPAADPPSIAKIQQIAKEQNATLVEYSIISNEKLYIWVIQPTGKVAFRSVDLSKLGISLADAAEGSRVSAATGIHGLEQHDTALADFVRGTRRDIGVPNRSIVFNSEAAEAQIMSLPTTESGPNPSLLQLHNLLISPIADLLPTDPNAHVIFIPQDSLFLVPFPALQDASGKYLIEKHTILTAPAIQVLDFTRQQRTRAVGDGSPDAEVLVVGNPIMPSVTIKVGQPQEQLRSLPGSKQEALAVAAMLNTQALIGGEATEAAVVQRIPKARIIHLATHGLFEDFTGKGVPGAIALTPSGKDDGLLTANEILDLKINADLVVLSACDTGRGKLTGDGVIGLSRALISSGTKSAIVSLWSVPDGPTAFLMTEFYRNLQQSGNKAQALRLAMLSTKQQNPEPKDWAAFTLIGESQ